MTKVIPMTHSRTVLRFTPSKKLIRALMPGASRIVASIPSIPPPSPPLERREDRPFEYDLRLYRSEPDDAPVESDTPYSSSSLWEYLPRLRPFFSLLLLPFRPLLDRRR